MLSKFSGSVFIVEVNEDFFSRYMHHQYTVTTDWPGGVYGSPTVSGSRAGGNIAVCWATLLHFGREGYVLATRNIIHTTKYIEKR